MGMIVTMQRFCYIECDTRGCGKKIEKNDKETLQDFARVCGWLKKAGRWSCPECKEKEKRRIREAKIVPKSRKRPELRV